MAEKKEILTRIIIEVAGKPKVHVETALNLVLERISKEKGISIIKKKVFKPKRIEGEFFSAFSEMEIRFDQPALLVGLCFDYLPSSVEIIEPETFSLQAIEYTHLLNDLLSKLHNINTNAAGIYAENENLKRNGESLLKNIVMLSLKAGAKEIRDISTEVGISPKDLKPFIDKYVKEDRLERLDNKYRLKKSLY